ncbi:MAG: hypothetical protein CMJ94_10685 [Planctomycetes bacterium]|nr:hypothetical protein [Planctomycetota bacterium]
MSPTPGVVPRPIPPTTPPTPVVPPRGPFGVTTPGAPPAVPPTAEHLRGWRGWWYRNRAHYFALVAQEQANRGFAQTAAGEVYLGLLGGQRAWADPQRLQTELPALRPLLEPWLASRRVEVALTTLSGMNRLGIAPPAAAEARFLRGNQAAQGEACRALGLRADAQAWRELRARFAGEHAEAAAHGLGLFALRSEDRQHRQAALQLLVDQLVHGFAAEARLQLACAEAIRVAAHRPAVASEQIARLAHGELLMPLLRDPTRPFEMRAALYVAVAQLLPEFLPASSARAELLTLCRAEVQQRRAEAVIQYGAVQAFGLVARPVEGDPGADLRWLAEVALHHRQRLVRPAASIALARIIGQLGWEAPAVEEHATPALLALLDDGDVALRPWAAMALGIAAVEARSRHQLDVPAAISGKLLDAIAQSRDADQRAAYALGLALLGDPAALPAIRREALKKSGRAAHPQAVQALGLRGSDDDARNLLATLDARQIDPWQLEATGEALAALGRMETRHILIERLDDRVAERQRAAARALGLYPTADTLTAYRALLNQADTGSPVLQAVILAVSRWQDAQPGLLRQACAGAWNPLLASRLDSWGREF